MHMEQGAPYPLGIKILEDGVNFAVSVPEGKECRLLLYKKGTTVPEHSVLMSEENAEGQVRFLKMKELCPKKYEYNYLIDDEVVIDPYARELTGHKEFGTAEDLNLHEVRCRMTEDHFDWEGDVRPKIPYNEVIAYSLHVRGFTKHMTSRVRHKGTFKGIIEKIPYLTGLGINQIQCMPVYEFVERTGNYQNYWGYGAACYYAPKAAYAASDSAANEFRQMIKECHKAGIEVVLEMPFTEKDLPQDILACLRFYMLEYHIDGFVVNPYRVSWEMLVNDPYLKGIKILRKEDRFQNIMRRFLKGDEGMIYDVIAELKHLTSEDGCCNYITTHTGFTLHDLVSYDGRHNEANGEHNNDGPAYNYSWNCGMEGPTRKKAIADLRKHQIYNAFFLMLMAQGTPCLLAGDEFGNTQEGNNNVYCQDNDLSWLQWSRKKGDEELLQFVKGLIAVRKAHPVLRRKEPLLGLDKTSCGLPDVSYHGENAWVVPADVASRQLGVLYSGRDMEKEDCFIAYNMHWEEHSFAIPTQDEKKEWYVVVDTSTGLTDGETRIENQKMVRVKPRSIMLLMTRPVKKAEVPKKNTLKKEIKPDLEIRSEKEMKLDKKTSFDKETDLNKGKDVVKDEGTEAFLHDNKA